MYSKKGLIYFINNITLNKHNYYMNLPEDLRRLIWKYAHIYPFIECYICDKVLINLEINMQTIKNKTNENYTIINGVTKCNTCFSD